MLRFLKWLVYLVIALVVIVVAGSFLLPAEAYVTRSADIEAPPEEVFAIVGDMRRFQEFSPWAALDPDTQYRFEGPESGVGQKMIWTSANPDVGSGTQTVVEYDPPRHVATELDLGGMGKAIAAWHLEPTATGTRATWNFRSPLDGIAARWFGLMFDRWIGADYEEGLARLKIAAEKPQPEANSE